jgi:1,4-dihydroxy-2-naphthoate octaprenyltransferase
MYNTLEEVCERSNKLMEMDTNNEAARRNVAEHLLQYDTMILATAEHGQPWTAGVFFAHEFTADGKLVLYTTMLKGSRKLETLKENPKVGFYVGPRKPTRWLQGSGRAVEARDAEVIAKGTAIVREQAPDAGMFIDHVPVSVVRIFVDQMALTDIAGPYKAELTFGDLPKPDESRKDKVRRAIKRLNNATGAGALPVMVMPVALGAALAWRDGNRFRPLAFGVTMLGAAAAHLAANVTNDYFDYFEGADERASIEPGAVDTSSGILTRGEMSHGEVKSLMWGLWGTAGAAGVTLAALSAPAVLALGAAGFALGYFYVAPPVKLGYIGRGLGEADVLLSFGVLPVLGSYYVQSRKLSWRAAVGSLPLGLLTTDVLFNHHFFHSESDRASGKMSPVAVLGESQAAKASAGLAIAAFASTVTGVLTKSLPMMSLAAISAAPKLLETIERAGKEKDLPAYGQLMASTMEATTKTGGLLIGAAVISGLLARMRGKR